MSLHPNESVPTTRERFCHVLAAQPMYRGDAIILLEGDGLARIPTAIELLRQGGGPFIVVSGGLDKPPHCITAEKMAGRLMGLGVAPDRLIIDNASLNTQEQATKVYALATEHGWRRLLLVASPYHAPRAFLTFLRVLIDAGRDKELHLVSVPAASSWFTTPDGLEATRLELLDDEFAKIDRYHEHVATYTEGLAYLGYWEAPIATTEAAA